MKNQSKKNNVIFDVKRICECFRDVHSRYYIDTNGCVYTSLSPYTRYILIDNKHSENITSFKNQMLRTLDKHSNMMCRFKNTDYYILYDGTILQRLKTVIKNNEVVVKLATCLNDEAKEFYFIVSHLVAGCFIDDLYDKELCYIDGDEFNYKLSNLKVQARHCS